MDYELLKASDGTGQAVLAHITANRLAGSSTLVVDSVDNWPQKFIATSGTVGSNGFLVPSTVREFVGHIDSGNIIIDSYEPGTVNDGHTNGQVVLIKQTTGWSDRVAAAALSMAAFIAAQGDWRTLPATISTAPTTYNKTQKSYELKLLNYDARPLVQKGHKMRVTRSNAPAAQCVDFETSLSQYATKVAPTALGAISDDITLEWNMYVESYVAGEVLSARSGANGWDTYISANGSIRIHGLASVGNHKLWQTKTSVPLNQNTHVAITMDMSGAVANIYFDGVPQELTASHAGTANSFANPNVITVGASNFAGGSSYGEFFDGKASDIRYWNVIRTPTQILTNMHNTLVGNEVGLVGYWKLDGNFNDSTSNANNLTASGGPTFIPNVFNKTLEYGIVTDITYTAPDTTVRLFTGSESQIPSSALVSPVFSTVKAPYGFPTEKDKWLVRMDVRQQLSRTFGAGTGSYYKFSPNLRVPQGAWNIKHNIEVGATSSISAGFDLRGHLTDLTQADSYGSGAAGLEPYSDLWQRFSQGWAGTYNEIPFNGSMPFRRSDDTLWSFYLMHSTGGTLAGGIRGIGASSITAECAYL